MYPQRAIYLYMHQRINYYTYNLGQSESKNCEEVHKPLARRFRHISY